MSKAEARDIFVKNLARIMRQKDKTQSFIASSLNIAPTTVSDWANGKKYPRVDAMQRLADLLGVTMAELTIDQEKKLEEELRLLQEKFIDKKVIALGDRNGNKESIEINFYDDNILLSLNGETDDFCKIFFRLNEAGRKEVLLEMLKRYC